MADPFTILLAGDILGAVLAVFTNSMGLWFYALMVLAFEILVYLKTENTTMVLVTGIIIMSVMSVMVPTLAMSFAVISFLITVAVILWKVFH